MWQNISVIIPALNAADRLPNLIELLQSQTLKPREIIVVDSSSEDGTAELASSYEGVEVEVIKRSEFNHGITRHEALLKSSGDFICFMTDDAIPANEYYLEKLIAPLADESVAMASGRQLPKNDARRYEQLVREFNYPPVSNIRSKEDIERLGIKTFFASDACSVYRRTAYMAVGGFQRVNTNEDMLIAAAFINAGYKVAYAADAQVFHSHNLSPKQQYLRNKEVGRFLKAHISEISSTSELGEGKKLVRYVSVNLLKKMQIKELFAFGIDCFARYSGNRAGRKDNW